MNQDPKPSADDTRAALYAASENLIVAANAFRDAFVKHNKGTPPIMWTVDHYGDAVVLCDESWIKVLRERLEGQPSIKIDWAGVIDASNE